MDGRSIPSSAALLIPSGFNKQHLDKCFLPLSSSCWWWQWPRPNRLQQPSPSKVITVTNGELEGQWGPLERCPPGSRAVSFRTRNELATPLFDDTALNTIVLYCNDELATNFTSTPGFSGDFQQIVTKIVTCPFGGYLTKFILRVSPSSGSSSSSDKTAANDIRFMCSNGYEINGPGNTGGDWGQESGECLDGICGMETRVQPFDGGLGHYDNTALNDVRFTCC